MKNCDKSCFIKDNGGFTLVELMITLVISGVIVAAIYSTYITQQRSYTSQEAVAEMQQNIRAAMVVMSADIRMAGYKPAGGTFSFFNGNFDNGGGQTEAVTTDATNIAFTADLDGDNILDRVCQDVNVDGKVDISEMEQIAYRLNANRELQRYSTATGAIEWHAVAENIENVEFQYLDAAGAVTAISTDIRAVQISILARAGRADRKFVNPMVYCPASNPFNPVTGLCTNPAPATVWGPFNDNLRRRLLMITIQCRNMGL